MSVWRRLQDLGICGVNRRSAEIIFPLNPRKFYPRVDDKRITKEIALRFGVPVPELYGVIRYHHELKGLDETLSPYERFVIKPAHGAQGKGILLVSGREGGSYRRTDGRLMTGREVGYYVSGILSGLHSLGGQVDAALIEAMIEADPLLAGLGNGGVPDIRVIVYRGVPLMSMARLPTRLSHGKANLHQGAVGLGVSIATGVTTYAIQKNRFVERHPDTGRSLSGIQVPHWEQILVTAAQAFEMTGLGYVGVDLAIDKERGPLVLELNARPGLSVQIANRAGILPRTRAVDDSGAGADGMDPAERAAWARKALAAL